MLVRICRGKSQAPVYAIVNYVLPGMNATIYDNIWNSI